jgi:predicted enzyme related to lactoylglutathione lyase
VTTSQQTVRAGTTITGVDLAAYFVRDPQRSIAFYRDVLGMTPTEIDEQARGAEFTLADGTTFGVWRPDKSDGVESGGVMMFAVGDVQAAVETFRARGATLTDPTESPVCFMAFGSDPDGNPFIIHQRKNAD